MPDSDSQACPSLSVVIPARDEEGCILETLQGITRALDSECIRYEVVLVDDGSTDNTAAVVSSFRECAGVIRLHQNTGRHGFGMAVKAGLDVSTGDYVAIMMADGSDSPGDLLNYFHTIQNGYDCVFGSRFVKGGKVIDYPSHKLLLNRLANFFIRMLFRLRYNDVTNAFKCYSREAIEAMQPLLSPHFNLTVEMPLKAIVRGFSYTVVPISWTNRKFGASKLKIKEMGSRYLFIVLYLWLEKYLARGDYHRGHAAKSESNTAIAARHV